MSFARVIPSSPFPAPRPRPTACCAPCIAPRPISTGGRWRREPRHDRGPQAHGGHLGASGGLYRQWPCRGRPPIPTLLNRGDHALVLTSGAFRAGWWHRPARLASRSRNWISAFRPPDPQQRLAEKTAGTGPRRRHPRRVGLVARSTPPVPPAPISRRCGRRWAITWPLVSMPSRFAGMRAG